MLPSCLIYSNMLFTSRTVSYKTVVVCRYALMAIYEFSLIWFSFEPLLYIYLRKNRKIIIYIPLKLSLKMKKTQRQIYYWT